MLHILNGDATKTIFEKSSIPGDIALWNEMLCEGPRHVEVGSQQFWNIRKSFFSNELKISEEDYQEKVISQFNKILDFGKFKEVVLWFEYDLFCQINLIALCSYFHTNWSDTIQISLVCTSDEINDGRLRGLGEFGSEDYPGLFQNRVDLGKENLEFAHQIWVLYCSEDNAALKAYVKRKFNPKFKYLKNALKAHLQRFPSKKNGLNEIDLKMINLIKEGRYSKHEIVGHMLRWQKWHGFADFQYFFYLKKLEPFYIVRENILYLNEEGKTLSSG